MIDRFPLAPAALGLILAAPAAAQLAPVGTVTIIDEAAIEEVNDGQIAAGFAESGVVRVEDPSAPVATGRINPYGDIGAGVGAAEESATAYRGPYGFGECPAGTIITPFGTCARR